MRSIYLMAAMAAMTVVGCSQNDITEVSPDANPVVGFSAYTGVQSRGAVIDGVAALATPGFGVFAFQTAGGWAATATPNFMYNQQVTSEDGGSSWTYDPVKYWPNNGTDKVSFFAYGPHNAEGVAFDAVGTMKDAPALTFTLPTADKLVDLLAAPSVIGKDKTVPTVAFPFAHLLTRATFKVALTPDIPFVAAKTKTHVLVKSMSIKKESTKFYDSAIFTFSGTDDAAGAWGTQTANNPADYSINSVLALGNVTLTEGGTYSDQAVDIDASTYTEAASVFTPDEYLFLIPATPKDGSGIVEGDVIVEIIYDVLTEDGELADKYTVSTTTATAKLPAGTMKQATAYCYTLTIGLESVKVSATVDSWGKEDEATTDTDNGAIPDTEI